MKKNSKPQQPAPDPTLDQYLKAAVAEARSQLKIGAQRSAIEALCCAIKHIADWREKNETSQPLSCPTCSGRGRFQEGGTLSPFVRCGTCKGTGIEPTVTRKLGNDLLSRRAAFDNEAATVIAGPAISNFWRLMKKHIAPSRQSAAFQTLSILLINEARLGRLRP